MTARMHNLRATLLAVLIGIAASVQADRAEAAEPATMTVAGGCFWCVESDFESVRGVIEAVSGFTGGHVETPAYKQVKKGDTGHYEAVRITFDPDVVTREALLHLFFRSVDPTDAGGQFCDRGDSYRTAVFVADEAEKATVEKVREAARQALGQPIVTPILPEDRFYPADDYHQDYYKGDRIVLTRFGPKRQSEAYKKYRQACGRDDRVKALWGNDAPFAAQY